MKRKNTSENHNLRLVIPQPDQPIEEDNMIIENFMKYPIDIDDFQLFGRGFGWTPQYYDFGQRKGILALSTRPGRGMNLYNEELARKILKKQLEKYNQPLEKSFWKNPLEISVLHEDSFNFGHRRDSGTDQVQLPFELVSDNDTVSITDSE